MASLRLTKKAARPIKAKRLKNSLRTIRTILERTKCGPSQRELDEHEYALYTEKQLYRLLKFVKLNGGDKEMIETVKYLIGDNKGWINKDLLV